MCAGRLLIKKYINNFLIVLEPRIIKFGISLYSSFFFFLNLDEFNQKNRGNISDGPNNEVEKRHKSQEIR